MTMFDSWRSWRIEGVRSFDGGSKPQSATPVWHGDQAGLFRLIENVRSRGVSGFSLIVAMCRRVSLHAVQEKGYVMLAGYRC